MPFYYFIFSALMLVFILFFIRSFIMRKGNLPVELFNEALKNENNGDFETAIGFYKSALDEADKSVFLTGLKYKIIAKLKVLHTAIDYQNSIRFIRQD
jgi:hypothetical protein